MSRKLKPKPKRPSPKQPPRWQRDKNISLFLWIAVPLVILITVGLVGYWGYDNYVAAWSRPVAVINDKVIDMDHYVKMLRLSSPTGQVDPYQLLAALEEDELVRQNAPKLGITVSSEEIQSAIEENSTSGNETSGIDFAEQYSKFLEQVKLSDEEYRQIVEVSLLTNKIFEYFKNEVVPEEAEQVHLHLIAAGNEGNATALYGQLTDGEDFASVSGNYSVIDSIKTSRGDMGWVPKGIYTDLDDTIFGLAVGNISQPIQTEAGYYIAKVSEKAESKPIDDSQRDILGYGEYQSWLKQERDSATIVRYLDSAKISWAIGKLT